MLHIIDGTGPIRDAEYKRDMSCSFCSVMESELGGTYHRGPNLFDVGDSTARIADRVFREIMDTAGRDTPIFLAGHSRGGAAVVRVAEKLSEKNIPVRALFLFDAVDRAADFVFTKQIPANVLATYHARRDVKLAKYYEDDLREAEARWKACMQTYSRFGGFKYASDPDLRVYNSVFGDPANETPSQCREYTTKMQEWKLLDLKMKLAMRANTVLSLDMILQFGGDGLSIDFSNTAVIPADPGPHGARYEERFFRGSHGAIGGAPITDDRAPTLLKEFDFLTRLSVHTWMWANFGKEKLSSTEKSNLPLGDPMPNRVYA